MKFFCETGSFSEFFEKDDTFATVKVVDTLDARQGMHLLNASNNGTATASDMFVNAIDDYSPQHNDTGNKLNAKTTTIIAIVLEPYPRTSLNCTELNCTVLRFEPYVVRKLLPFVSKRETRGGQMYFQWGIHWGRVPDWAPLG